MFKFSSSSITAGAMLSLFVIIPAHAAGATRAWVSGHGTDAAGCGAPTDPCRSLQYVVSSIIAAGGEIDILDPSGYGTVAIPFALSIVNDGVGTAGVQATSGNAITITAGASDNVTLRGLNIDGLGSGSNGIVFTSGASLTVTNCVIRHFAKSGTAPTTGNGILMQPGSGSLNFVISNTITSDNGFNGVFYLPVSGGTGKAYGVIDHVIATNNGNSGVAFNTLYASGGAVAVTLSNSIASNNSNYGAFFNAPAGTLTATVNSSFLNTNITGGIYGGDTAKILLGRSVITSNASGALNETSPNSFYTYNDNRIDANTAANISGSALLTSTPN